MNLEISRKTGREDRNEFSELFDVCELICRSLIEPSVLNVDIFKLSDQNVLCVSVINFRNVRNEYMNLE